MRKLTLIGLLALLTSCSDPITSGSIINKHVKIHYGVLENTTEYYIVIKQGNQTGTIQVNEATWQQAENGMKWPFKVE